MSARLEPKHLGEVARPRERKKTIHEVVKETPVLTVVTGPKPTLQRRRSRMESAYSALAFLTVVVMVGVFDGAVAYGLRGVTLALFLLFAWSVIGVLVCVGCYFAWKNSGIMGRNEIKN